MIEVAKIATAIAGTASAVGAVGAAGLGVRVLVRAFRDARAAGLNHKDSLHYARSQEAALHREQMTPADREAQGDAEANWMAQQDTSAGRQRDQDAEAEWMAQQDPAFLSAQDKHTY